MSEMSEMHSPGEVADRIITRTEVWRAVVGPVQCQCGHVHYGRIPAGTTIATYALQWGFCEDPDCKDHALRVIRDGLS